MNAVSWFEIPVSDMQRAMSFYNAVFGFDLKVNLMGELQMAWFPADHTGPGASGSLIKHEAYTPSTEGALVYFACEDVAENISRVEDAGGQVMKEKIQISEEVGFMALALDTEGNRIAFHSVK